MAWRESAHLLAKQPSGLRRPTLASVFETVIGGKVYTVAAFQGWIINGRSERKDPAGCSFRKRC